MGDLSVEEDEITIRVLGPDEAFVLDRVDADVFDGPVEPRWVSAFLAASNHQIAVALAGDLVVAMASGVIHVHPDKAPELWINEVSTATAWRRRGLARRCVTALISAARDAGAATAWVLTEDSNAAARALYRNLKGEETLGVVMVSWPEGSAR